MDASVVPTRAPSSTVSKPRTTTGYLFAEAGTVTDAARGSHDEGGWSAQTDEDQVRRVSPGCDYGAFSVSGWVHAMRVFLKQALDSVAGFLHISYDQNPRAVQFHSHRFSLTAPDNGAAQSASLSEEAGTQKGLGVPGIYQPDRVSGGELILSPSGRTPNPNRRFLEIAEPHGIRFRRQLGRTGVAGQVIDSLRGRRR